MLVSRGSQELSLSLKYRGAVCRSVSGTLPPTSLQLRILPGSLRTPTLPLPCVAVLREALSLVYWGESRKNAGLVSEFRGEPHSELRGCRSSPRQIYT